MKKSKKHSFTFYIVLLISVIFMLYCLSFYSYNEDSGLIWEEEASSESSQDDLYWGHMPLTYHILNEKECGRIEVEEINLATKEIEKATAGRVTFLKVDSNADINIKCSFTDEDCYDLEIEDYGSYKIYSESICEHDLGIAQITDTQENQIIKAEIEFIGLWGFVETRSFGHGGQSGFTLGQCQRAITEVHEFLHVLGFDHVDDPYSIMNPYADWAGGRHTKDCNEIPKLKIDDWIVRDLVRIYGIYGNSS